MDSKKLKKRKRQADKPMRIFEELNRPVTYIIDDVKETVITENTYKAIPYNVLKTYFLPKGMFQNEESQLTAMVGWLFHCYLLTQILKSLPSRISAEYESYK